MRLLVTGASGFIGRRLLPRLRADGHAPVALLMPEEAVPAHLAGGDVPIVRGDITDATSLAGVAKDCEGVVHLAAAVGYSQRMDHCLRVNRDGTANVVREAARAEARRFVQLSSVAVYGRAPGVRLDESAPLRKMGDPYGDTKIDAERLLVASAERDEIDLTMLRPVVIHGPGDRLFLPRLIENVRSGRARLIGRGRNTVDAVHVDDVVEVIARVLGDRRSIGRIYNVNHPSNPTWRELVTEVARALAVPPPRAHVPYPVALAMAGVMEAVAKLQGREPLLTRYAVRVVGRQYHYGIDRMRDELGFLPRHGLIESVRQEILGRSTEGSVAA